MLKKVVALFFLLLFFVMILSGCTFALNSDERNSSLDESVTKTLEAVFVDQTIVAELERLGKELPTATQVIPPTATQVIPPTATQAVKSFEENTSFSSNDLELLSPRIGTWFNRSMKVEFSWAGGGLPLTIELFYSGDSESCGEEMIVFTENQESAFSINANKLNDACYGRWDFRLVTAETETSGHFNYDPSISEPNQSESTNIENPYPPPVHTGPTPSPIYGYP